MICPTCRHIHHDSISQCWVCGTVFFVEPPPPPPPPRPVVDVDVDAELPAWFESVSYSGDDDRITVVVAAPGGASTPEQIERLVELLTKCLRRSKERRSVIDLPT